MEKYQFLENSEILLFRSIAEQSKISPPLNEFISYLKYHRVMGPYKFSYVGIDGNLIPDLTLKQNLMLDYTNASLTEEKEAHFKNYLKNRPNIHLEALYGLILNINDVPKNATKEEIKIVALIKALISEAPFIFLERPEVDLSDAAFALFQEALKLQIERSGQNVFLMTYIEENWVTLVTKVVSRNADFSFQTKSPEFKEKFVAEKKKFYANINQEKEEANQSKLVFKLPKKKSA